jgi:hypothetical protein
MAKTPKKKSYECDFRDCTNVAMYCTEHMLIEIEKEKKTYEKRGESNVQS